MSKIYAEILEEEALSQFNNAIKHPDCIACALMADAHTGYDLPIGGVVGLKNTIVPSWVGYDIGCGMCALKLNLTKDAICLSGKEKEILEQIYRYIPSGEGNFNKEPLNHNLDFKGTKLPQIARREIKYQLGTLGGGNHFIEIGYDRDDFVWVTIHSGSRGVGWKIADAYMSFDKENKGFSLDGDIGKQYMADMNFCLEFALLNRKTMIKRVVSVIRMVLGRDIGADWENLINRNHNHAERNHGMIIHRKGATHAEKGMMGVIPGNMRDGVFIVEGQGCSDALWSSSHGAGRVLSRKKARENIALDDFKETMGGITAKVCEKTKDESPDAYKDIFEVIRIQEEQGLIKVINYIKPLINVKGI